MHLGTSLNEKLRARIRPRKTEHLMARVDQLRNKGRTDKACSSCNKDTHTVLF